MKVTKKRAPSLIQKIVDTARVRQSFTFESRVVGIDKCDFCAEVAQLAIVYTNWEPTWDHMLIKMFPEGKPGYACKSCLDGKSYLSLYKTKP